MPLPTLVIHVVPIQITLNGTTVTIRCDDPRASVVDDEIVFTLDDLGPDHPAEQQRVSFVAEDPADTSQYDYYLNVSSAPPLERLVAWKRNGSVSRSPEFLPGAILEVVAVVYGVPQPTSPTNAPVKVGHARRRFKLVGNGGSGGF